jgi:GDP-4-dehydro-6-deoxy-D-mannose reductase
MRLLVTGRHGFVGTALARLVGSDPDLAGWTVAEVPPDIDLGDAAAARTLVDAAAPDTVIHLAAQSFVPESFRDPAQTLRVNVFGTLHLLQALRLAGFTGRLVFASTGDVYGNVPESELPISEARLPVPRNPYAVSKLAAEALCQQWAITEGMHIVIARPFNHIGAGQSDRFVVSDFARQIAEAKLGRRAAVVEVGDVDVTRDFTDVGDVVRGYFALLRGGRAGERYNLCSGRETSVRDILARLAELSGVEIAIRQDPSRLRRSEQRRVAGDPAKVRAETGWSATTPIDESLRAMLHYWEDELENG